MAELIKSQTSEKITIHVNHTFGRDEKTNLSHLESPGASRNHAVIAWDGDVWQIKDTSSNGSFINGVRLPRGVYQQIKDGSKIQFGNLPSETWEVLDLNPPITCLRPLTKNGKLIPLHDVEILLIEEKEIMIYMSEEGDWVCEVDDETHTLKSGHKVGFGNQYWQFMDAKPCEATATSNMAPPPGDIEFGFNVSRDEEHVSLKLIIDNTEIDFGERSHHYLLLHLARHRLGDRQRGLELSEQGWMSTDQLVRDLGMTLQHANTQIYRFRKLVANQLPEACLLHQVIERRPGQLRFAYHKIRVVGGIDQEHVRHSGK